MNTLSKLSTGVKIAIFAAIALLVFGGVFLGITLTRNVGMSEQEITAEDAEKKMNSLLSGINVTNVTPRKAAITDEDILDKEEELPEEAELRQLRQRPAKQKPVNHFVNETSKPSPALTKAKVAKTPDLEAGDTVRHVTFGIGRVLTVRPMGGDTLYEIAFESVGTKKLMATYARLTKLS